MTTNDNVRCGLRIPIDLNTKLAIKANKKGISKNALILEILWNYIEELQEA